MYAPYKRNRKEMADAMTEKEKEEKEKSGSDEESIASDEIDTNKYTTLKSILRELTKKGDVAIIGLSLTE